MADPIQPNFVRLHHRRIAQVLTALNASLLSREHCYFGGGTAISLAHGEYRESVDIDFLVSDLPSYRRLRGLVTGAMGIQSLAAPGATLTPLRQVRADQYGLRTALEVGGAPIKFEIILEARMRLDPSRASDTICGVETLAPIDKVSSKLLANADRWADDSVMSRDVIDLAMMRPPAKLLKAGIAKAEIAYGDAIAECLAKAITALKTRQTASKPRIDHCMNAMQMTIPKATLWQGLDALEKAMKKP